MAPANMESTMIAPRADLAIIANRRVYLDQPQGLRCPACQSLSSGQRELRWERTSGRALTGWRRRGCSRSLSAGTIDPWFPKRLMVRAFVG